MTGRLLWERDGLRWPNRHASRFVKAGGLNWHVQLAGDGPTVLLLHGTGSSTHSWRRLLPLAAEHYTIVAPDLPGHGFTETPAQRELSLPGMSRSVSELLRVMQLEPEFVVGHSAGAAILIRACLDGAISPNAIVSINGALLPFSGRIEQLFAPLAKLLASSPFVSRVMSWRATNRTTVELLLRNTGSSLERDDIDLYAKLFQCAGHVSGALGMMANWNLSPLVRDLPKLRTPLVLIAGELDAAIPPADAIKVSQLVRGASVIPLPGLGHLAHEEQPEKLAEIIMDAFANSRLAASA